MRIKEITATWGGKINLGNYNSAHVEMTASAILDEGEDQKEAMAQLWEIVQESVRTEARKLVAVRKAQVDEIFAGLPVEAKQQINGGGNDNRIN
jgi:hypothetical protein